MNCRSSDLTAEVKMTVLGIDSTTKFTNIGLARCGEIIAETGLELGRTQASKLPLLTEELLVSASVGINSLEALAVANGPGYYTGIRTGVAYSTALAQALGLRVVPLSSLEVFVHDLRTMGVPLAPVFKARQDCVYCALYFSDGKKLSPFVYPKFCHSAEFADFISLYPDALIVGRDAELFDVLSPLPNKILPRASGRPGEVALMGAIYKELSIPPEEVRGAYLREPDIGPTPYI